MDPILVGLLFAFGILVQAIILRKGRNNTFIAGMIIVCAVLAAFYSKAGGSYGFTFILTFSILFPLMFCLYFKKDILPQINERVLLAFTILFWYIVAKYFETILWWPLWALALLPTLGTLALSVTNASIGAYSRAFFYAWFIFMAFFMGVYQFLYGPVAAYIINRDLPPLELLGVFFAGMAFLYLLGHLVYLSELIPLPSTKYSYDKRIRIWKGDISLLVSKYSDEQVDFGYLLVMAAVAGFFALNYFLGLLPSFLLINFFVLALEFTILSTAQKDGGPARA